MSNSPTSCPLCKGLEHQRVSEYKSSDLHFLSADSIVRCDSCGLVFASPVPSEEEVDQFYKTGDYHNEFKSDNLGADPFFIRLAQSRIDLIEKHLSINSVKKCLDIGGGYGIFGRALKDRFPAIGYHIVEPGRHCRQCWGDWVDQSFTDLSEVSENDYDLIVLNQVLEHVVKPLNFMKNLSEKMAPCAVIFIEVPNRDDKYKPSVTPHLFFWEPTTLRLVAEKAGLGILFCDSVGMRIEDTKRHFQKNRKFIRKIFNPWSWLGLLNRGLTRIRFPFAFDVTGQYRINQYGGQRQWIRIIAHKTKP